MRATPPGPIFPKLSPFYSIFEIRHEMSLSIVLKVYVLRFFILNNISIWKLNYTNQNKKSMIK
jgi:hypothetical protein